LQGKAPNSLWSELQDRCLKQAPEIRNHALEARMRLISSDGGKPLHQVQLYLSVAEGRKLVAELEKLIANPEASEHFHVISESGGAELSCSIVTARKLESGGYER
jgi:hypothetical protein